MSFLEPPRPRVLVQGITGNYARNQVLRMLAYGTHVVAGVTLGRGGERLHEVPIFDTVAEAVRETGAEASVAYVPASAALEAVWEAVEAGLSLVVVPTEGVPVHDAMRMREIARTREVWLVGPNTPGLIRPGETLLGALAPDDARPGPVAVLSRSGTLAFEAVRLLTEAGIGQRIVVGVGGDIVIGRNPVEYLLALNADPATKAVILLGEVGGAKEYEVAEAMGQMKKPVVAYVAGRHAPRGRRLGHVGAVIRREGDEADAKCRALERAGAHMAQTLWDLPEVVNRVLNG